MTQYFHYPTIPLSGSVTANQGTANTLANGWPVKPTDGTNSQSFLATGEGKVSVTQPLPTGTNTIGSVKPTDGTNSQAYTAGGAAKVDGSATTQPVSGTVTANQGTANSAANGWTVKPTDGTNSQAYTAGGAAKVDGSAVTQPISGAVNQGTANSAANGWTVKPTDGTNSQAFLATGEGKVSVTQPLPTGTNAIGTVQPGNTANTTPWLMTVSQGGNAATVTAGNALKVDGSAVTQPVTGTGTAGTAASGVVTVQGIASMTPVAVSTGTVATASNQKKGKIAGTALTGAYATVVATSFAVKIAYIFNSCDQTIVLSLDGGVTDAFELEASESFSMDLATNGLNIASSVNIQAKHNGVAPTSGTIRVATVG